MYTPIHTMFCVERSEGPNSWVKELCFKTEFMAFSNARTKSLNSFSSIYRVMYEGESPNSSGEVLRVSKGKCFVDDDRLVG